MTITGWSAEAFNQIPDSENEIHGDRVSRLYGFEGGLVPGVTISAYLMHPAVVAWGEDFMTRGRAHVRVVSPLYDGEQFTVAVADVEQTGYRAELRRPDDTLSAVAEVTLPEEPADAPQRRGDPVVDSGWQGPDATEEHWQKLRAGGCTAVRFHWSRTDRMARYLRAEEAMPALFTGEHAAANPAYLLVLSNWVLAANGRMNPWVHLETTSQHFRPVRADADIVAEMAVRELFERKGHRFVDATIDLYDEADDGAIATIDLRAIYRLRGM